MLIAFAVIGLGKKIGISSDRSIRHRNLPGQKKGPAPHIPVTPERCHQKSDHGSQRLGPNPRKASQCLLHCTPTTPVLEALTVSFTWPKATTDDTLCWASTSGRVTP